MTIDIEISLQEMVTKLARCTAVRAIGLSGGERPFPQPGEGNIDLFVERV